MTAVHGIGSEKTPAMLSDDELWALVGEMLRNQPIGYFDRLKNPNFIPVGELEKQHHAIVSVMIRRNIV